MENEITQHIEALIFTSSKPIKVNEIYAILDDLFDVSLTEEEVVTKIDLIKEKYTAEDYSFEIIQKGGGYQFMSKPAYHHTISVLDKHRSKKRLSPAAMECLAIIAYKQPITKIEVEKIRGVNCDYTIQKLLEKELIDIQGRSDLPGKPILYGTSERFMEHFGINCLEDLPKPKDVDIKSVSEIGIRQEI